MPTPTRAQVRAQIRTRLEDLGLSPLWDDATINDAILAALLRYGTRMPRQETLTVTLPAGATSHALPAPPGDDPGRILRVLDERGAVVARAHTAPSRDDGRTGTIAQGWRVWNGALLLDRPAQGGDWRIEYLAPRAAPADDAAPLDLLPGDEEAIAELTIALLLRHRLIADAKRGHPTNLTLEREVARAESAAWTLLDRRRRVASGGWLGG